MRFQEKGPSSSIPESIEGKTRPACMSLGGHNQIEDAPENDRIRHAVECMLNGSSQGIVRYVVLEISDQALLYPSLCRVKDGQSKSDPSAHFPSAGSQGREVDGIQKCRRKRRHPCGAHDFDVETIQDELHECGVWGRGGGGGCEMLLCPHHCPLPGFQRIYTPCVRD